MAQVINQNDLDQNNQNQQNQQNQNQQQTIQTYNPPKHQQSQGTGYTNIQRIVGANQQNRLGQAIGQGVQQNIGNLQNRLGQAQNQFQQQTQQNRFDQPGNQQLVQNVLSNPTGANQQQQNQFTRLISGQYQGPQQLQNAEQISAQSGDIADLGRSAGTAGGRQGLLQRFVAGPQQYTAGQQSLDNLILGQTGVQDLNAARRNALQQQGMVNTQLSGAQSIGQEMANRAKGIGQDVATQFGQNVSDINQQLTNQAIQAQNERNQQLQQIQNQLAQGQISQDMANQLGITSGSRMLNIDPTKFLTPGAIQASAQNVATAGDYARLNALRQLSGGFGGDQTQGILGQFAGQDQQAGKFGSTPAYQLNADQFKTAYNTANQQYQNAYNQTAQPLNEMQTIANIYDKYGFKPGQKISIFDPNYARAEAEIRQIAPGALGGDPNQNFQYVQNELSKRRTAHQNMLNQLNQQFGTGTFTVGNQ